MDLGVQIRLIFWFWLFCVTVFQTHAEICPAEIYTKQVPTVAKMCSDSSAMGSNLYIDSIAASGTRNETNLELCTCSISMKKVKFLSIKVTGTTAICGTSVEFAPARTNGLHFSTPAENCSLTTKEMIQVDSFDEFQVSLKKLRAPFISDYCVQISINTCGEGMYQCDGTGECIPGSDVCNSSPDCPNDDDEESSRCKSAVCNEGKMPCSDRRSCFSEDERCNNVTNCADGSDEHNCTGTETEQMVTTPSPEPMIRIKCSSSTMFTTTAAVAASPETTVPDFVAGIAAGIVILFQYCYVIWP